MALTSGSCEVQLQAFEMGKHRIKISVKWKQTTQKNKDKEQFSMPSSFPSPPAQTQDSMHMKGLGTTNKQS